MMKKILFTAMLCCFALCLQAQSPRKAGRNSGIRITRDYQNVSLSKVLEDLNATTDDKTIYFIYDELEDFTVTSHFYDLSLMATKSSSSARRRRTQRLLGVLSTRVECRWNMPTFPCSMLIQHSSTVG